MVNLAKEHGLKAFNRDRGGAQHEQVDVEIQGMYWGCKRRKQTARWLYPEKEEYGVFFREDRGEAMIAMPAEFFIKLMYKSLY